MGRTCSCRGSGTAELDLSQLVNCCAVCGLEIDRDFDAACNFERVAASSASTTCGKDRSGAACAGTPRARQGHVNRSPVRQEPDHRQAHADAPLADIAWVPESGMPYSLAPGSRNLRQPVKVLGAGTRGPGAGQRRPRAEGCRKFGRRQTGAADHMILCTPPLQRKRPHGESRIGTPPSTAFRQRARREIAGRIQDQSRDGANDSVDRGSWRHLHCCHIQSD